MRTLTHNTIATQITGVETLQNNVFDAWAFFAPLASKSLLLKKLTRLASSSLLLKGVFVFYLYLYLYVYGNDRW